MELLAVIGSEAARNEYLDMVDKRLRGREYRPQARCAIPRRGEDAATVGGEDCARHGVYEQRNTSPRSNVPLLCSYHRS